MSINIAVLFPDIDMMVSKMMLLAFLLGFVSCISAYLVGKYFIAIYIVVINNHK